MNQPGLFWPQDRWGRVLNAALDRDSLPAQVLEAGEDALSLCLERFGAVLHSVYLSGPAARGRRGGARFVAVLRSTQPSLSAEAFCVAAGNVVRQAYPGLGPIQIRVYGWRDVFPTNGRFSYARFRLGVNSLCLAGRDLNRLIGPQVLTTGAANPAILECERRLKGLAHRLKAVSSDGRIRATASAAAQSVLAAGASLVMQTENAYSEDADVRAGLFLLHYDDRANAINWAERLAFEPTNSALEGLAFIEDVLDWLPAECDHWLDQHNPAREKALKVTQFLDR